MSQNRPTLPPNQNTVLTSVELHVKINQIYQTLMWTSPLLNPKCGQVEPPTEFRRDGLLAFADGTNWNPGGGGEGLYRYESGAATWVKVG